MIKPKIYSTTIKVSETYSPIRTKSEVFAESFEKQLSKCLEDMTKDLRKDLYYGCRDDSSDSV